MSAAMANASLSVAAPLRLSRASKFVSPGAEGATEVSQDNCPLSFGGVRARESALGAAKCGTAAGRGRRGDWDSARQSLRWETCQCERTVKGATCLMTAAPLKTTSGVMSVGDGTLTRLGTVPLRQGEQKQRHAAALAASAGATAAAERPMSGTPPSPSELVDSLLDVQLSAGTSGTTGEDVFVGSPGAIALRRECKEALEGLRWPTNKDEEYRFTDLRSLLNEAVLSQIIQTQVRQSGNPPTTEESRSGFEALIDMPCCELEEASSSRVVVVDGVLSPSLSSIEAFDEGDVIVDRASNLSEMAYSRFVEPHLGRLHKSVGDSDRKLDVFTLINGAAVRDVTVVVIPDGLKLQMPIHIVYYSSCARIDGGGVNLSNPRTLVVVGKDAEVDVVEEFVGDSTGGYWSNSVLECVLEEGATLRHGYVQEQARGAFHIKRTAVTQKEASSYSVVEVGIGGQVTRHNLQIFQLGPDTNTSVSTFMLAGHKQLHDLHSSIVLNHPRGKSNQLHKCIVTDSTGHGVFDGNVRVNRYAQQTDAGQLSRNLLLAPRATVNVKPNLQIIADDVKCTHGATVSDLEEEQLFYFRARGIDAVSARSALVFSFGAEVLEEFPYEDLAKRLEGTVKRALAEEGVPSRRRGV
ncbi:hypothetical protein CBR_g5706 [Chara braunii]|uniref:Uncharacterized protein n=1 Tax=Chara braunii TaxID=69332 RepID=A0A388KJC5_CHABU|nr:hypothetical protein CBR_g5706 [Chara braunii]|eukprot:GBG70073.1 hypothetical protein CBR_g5706 [Chara braunii]